MSKQHGQANRRSSGILQNDNVSGSEVNAQPSCSGTEKKHELGRPLGVKLVHLRVAAFTFRVAAANEVRETKHRGKDGVDLDKTIGTYSPDFSSSS